MTVNKYMYSKPGLVNNYVDRCGELTAVVHNNMTDVTTCNARNYSHFFMQDG